MSNKNPIVGALIGLVVLSQNAVTGVPRLTVSRGNKKIHPSIAVVSLPAPSACPGAGICLLFCYFFKVLKGLQGVVLAAVKSNYEASQRDDFVDRMVETLSKMKKIVGVRVHDGGDFYNDTYIKKWAAIASRLKHLKFFAYTKSVWMDFSPLERLPNFTLIKSYGGNCDGKIDKTRDNYAVVIEDERQKKGDETLCPADKPGVKLTGNIEDTWCGYHCNCCLPPNGKNGRKIRLAFIERDDGWNGVPDDADRRILGVISLIEKGQLRLTSETHRRRLEAFKRRHMKDGSGGGQ